MTGCLLPSHGHFWDDRCSLCTSWGKALTWETAHEEYCGHRSLSEGKLVGYMWPYITNCIVWFSMIIRLSCSGIFCLSVHGFTSFTVDVTELGHHIVWTKTLEKLTVGKFFRLQLTPCGNPCFDSPASLLHSATCCAKQHILLTLIIDYIDESPKPL